MITEIKNKIHALVHKYEQGKDVYRTARFNETQVRNEFLDPLFEIMEVPFRRFLCSLSAFLASVSASLKRKNHASILSVKMILQSKFVVMVLLQV